MAASCFESRKTLSGYSYSIYLLTLTSIVHSSIAHPSIYCPIYLWSLSTCSSIFICFCIQQLLLAKINQHDLFQPIIVAACKNKWRSNYKSEGSIENLLNLWLPVVSKVGSQYQATRIQSESPLTFQHYMIAKSCRE